MKLGTMDWGVGGLDLHARLLQAGVARDAVYLSDAGHTPYGRLAEPALASRVATLVRWLATRGCTDVVLACNAASSVLEHPDVRAAAAPLRSIGGVVQPAVDATLSLGARQVTVLGGERTVASGVYEIPLRAAGVEVAQRVAQPLSAFVEAGELSGDSLDACLDEVLAPVRDAAVVVLGCTHYPALASAIRARLPRLEALIDPAEEAARALVAAWGPADEPASAGYWTSGDPRASALAARRAFDLEVSFDRAADLAAG